MSEIRAIERVRGRVSRGRRGVREVPEEKKPKYPDRRVLYNPKTFIGELFNTLEDIEKALASGDWIIHPGMSLEDYRKKQEETEDEEEEEEHINWAERLKFRKSNTHVAPKRDMSQYISQMTVAQLIEEGKKYDIDFSIERPNKMGMRRQIKIARNKKTGARFT